MCKKLTLIAALLSLAALLVLPLGTNAAKPPQGGGKTVPGGPGVIALNNWGVITLINPDGTRPTPVAVADDLGYEPSWSPVFSDGTVKLAYGGTDLANWVAYLNVVNVFSGLDTPSPYLDVDVIPTRVQGLLLPDRFYRVDWSPAQPEVVGTVPTGRDIVRVAFAIPWDESTGPTDTPYVIWIVDLIYHPLTLENDLDRGKFTVAPSMYVNGQFSPVVLDAGPGAYYWVPRFSPDGQWLALSRYDRQPDGNYHGSIWVAKADGSEARKLLDQADVSSQWPAWSPVSSDGYQLAFVRGWDIYVASLRADMYVTSVNKVTQSKNPVEVWPTWSPDGGQVAYCINTVIGTIGKVLLDTGVQYKLAAAGGFPDWSPPGVPGL